MAELIDCFQNISRHHFPITLFKYRPAILRSFYLTYLVVSPVLYLKTVNIFLSFFVCFLINIDDVSHNICQVRLY